MKSVAYPWADCHPLEYHQSHYYVRLGEMPWLLDTGTPFSFGCVSPIALGGRQFELPPQGMGLNVTNLGALLELELGGVIGADILAELDTVLNHGTQEAVFSTSALEFNGEHLDIQMFLGVPIVELKLQQESYLMYFDTGAKLTYFQGVPLDAYPQAGEEIDFFPTLGSHRARFHWINAFLGHQEVKLRAAPLPALMAESFAKRGLAGILGNEVLVGRVLGFFPRRKQIALAHPIST